MTNSSVARGRAVVCDAKSWWDISPPNKTLFGKQLANMARFVSITHVHSFP